MSLQFTISIQTYNHITALKCWRCYDSYSGVLEGMMKKRAVSFTEGKKGGDSEKTPKERLSLTQVLTRGCYFVRCLFLVIVTVVHVFVYAMEECYAGDRKHHKTRRVSSLLWLIRPTWCVNQRETRGWKGLYKHKAKPWTRNKKIFCQNYNKTWKTMAR